MDIENPQVGQIVRVRPGTRWCGKIMRDEEYEITRVADYRPEGLEEVIVVVQPRVVCDYFRRPENGAPGINPEHGAYLFREAVTTA